MNHVQVIECSWALHAPLAPFIHLVGQIFENQLQSDHCYSLNNRLYMISTVFLSIQLLQFSVGKSIQR